jgi:LmbE family N-acetylglucosaminyl deacetylase
MTIFAHPDDETVISPVLAKYASLADVHIVVATDRRFGVTDHFGMSLGDFLVAVRALELTFACVKTRRKPAPLFRG